MSADKTRATELEWEENKGSWWERRSKLEKKLIIGLALAIVTLIGFAFLFALKSTASPVETCTTSACLEAASQIVTHLDTTVDPCEDFFKFTCGKFIENAHGDIKVTSVKETKAQVSRQLEELIKEPISKDDHLSVKRQKKLFQACMNQTSAEEESMALFEEHLEELHGWPVTMDNKWIEKRFDWINTVVQLKKWGYPFEMMLGFTPVPDPKDTSKIILSIQEPLIYNMTDERKEIYRELMTKTAVLFGAEKERAKYDMQKVLDFKEKLREIAKENDYDAKTEDDYIKVVSDLRFTVDEFQEFNNQIDWLDFINAILYPSANITSKDYVVFPKKKFMKSFFNLVYRTPKRIQANYIIWTVVEAMMPLLTKEVQELMGNYSCQIKTEIIPTNRFKFCNQMLEKGFVPKALDIVYARKYLPEEKRHHVQQIVSNVKKEFLVVLEENEWMDEESKENVIEKLEAVKEIIGAPGDYYNDTIFDGFEEYGLDDDKHKEKSDEDEDDNEDEDGEDEEHESFINLVLNHMKLQNDLILSCIQKGRMEIADQLFYNLITTVNAVYLLSDNSLMIPAAILQGIFFDHKRPMYLNYGSIGSIIGHELTHGVSKDSSEFSMNGSKAEIWTEKTSQAFEDVTQCMIQNAEEFDVEGTDSTINGTITLEENIADFTGVKISYKAYKNWVEKNGEEPRLPGINYSPQQLFWVAAIMHECYALRGEGLERGLANDFHANNAYRATGPMRNNPNFAEDFSCPVDSNMNPKEKCQVF